jgi:Na+/H+ antiporter NhaC
VYEVLAIGVGVLVGSGMALTRSPAKTALLAVLGVAGAVGVFAASGEIEISLEFLAWDLFQVAAAAFLTRLLVRRLVESRTVAEASGGRDTTR